MATGTTAIPMVYRNGVARSYENKDMEVGLSRSALEAKTVAEFFAGIGLMRIGLEQAGWSVTFANDIALDKQQMYLRHFHDKGAEFVLDDIHKLQAESIPSVTLATASFPCNDLSLAGMRKGLAGNQSSAYWGFVRILEEMRERRPAIVLLENVAGFLTSHEGKDFQSALSALNKLGYAVDALVINAENFVPQSRVRLFVIGIRQPLHGAWQARETPSFFQNPLRPKALADFILLHPEISWNLRELPSLPKRELQLSDILEDLPDSSDIWWSKERTDYLVGQMSDRHGTVLQEMMNGSKWSYGTVFRRIRMKKSMAELRSDGIAGCLRTPRGGSGRQILVKAGFGNVKARLLTPRECARLMGADNFIMDAPLNQSLFGFGDAVCSRCGLACKALLKPSAARYSGESLHIGQAR